MVALLKQSPSHGTLMVTILDLPWCTLKKFLRQIRPRISLYLQKFSHFVNRTGDSFERQPKDSCKIVKEIVKNNGFPTANSTTTTSTTTTSTISTDATTNFYTETTNGSVVSFVNLLVLILCNLVL